MIETAKAFPKNDGHRSVIRRALFAPFFVLTLLLFSCAGIGIGTGGTGYQGEYEREREIASEEELSKEERQALSRAAELYRRAVEEEGCADGIVLFRYARTLELLEGESLRIRQLYLRAKGSLQRNYPDHYYLDLLDEGETGRN